MYELTKAQEAALFGMRAEVAEKAEDLFNAPIRLSLFTYYPATAEYGCTIVLSGKIYFGKGPTIEKMLNAVLRSKVKEQHISPSATHQLIHQPI